ncbi:MAG: ABC transporter ATP-binding protein [Acidimicrobiia bacterium]|nr:ABC transporter ATP-binding protein [Acidimicrobiia bacterium]MDH3463669.1 ABC transporter ATP-binding protein [Acidimicrobiia bacterium]
MNSPSASDGIAVSVEGLTVKYRAMIDQGQTMKSALRRLGRNKQEVRYIEALKDINLQVKHGEFLGVIGHNGAGKSTLLRTIAGILPPTKGRIVVNGHVTTLLSVGIGFNGELTGRENIRLGGLANGLTPKEIELTQGDIIEFAGLGDFIDYPMKTYSSGMRGRLGFSVAVAMEPDILLIDEALSAGDAEFKEKASAKMRDIMKKARAIILVSHGLGAVKEMASDCLWLDHGRVARVGKPDEVIQAYTDHVKAGSSAVVHDDV